MPSCLFRRLLLVALLVTGFSASVSGAEVATNIVLRVHGEVARPLAFTLAELDALPHVKQSARDHDGEEASYEGVLLTELLQRAGVPLRENLRGPALRLGVLVKAADGYGALFSLGELDADMTDRWIFLADAKAGGPLPAGQGPLRIIVPGEKRHARWVRQVTELEVVRVGAAAALSPPARTNSVPAGAGGPAKP